MITCEAPGPEPEESLRHCSGTVNLAFVRDFRFGDRPLGARMILLLPGALASAYYGGDDERSHSQPAEEARQPDP